MLALHLNICWYWCLRYTQAGGHPEHNFRHNHSLMEWQMRRAIAGAEQVFAGDPEGWNDIVEAVRMVQHTACAVQL